MTALHFEHAFGTSLLARRPDLTRSSLQAWDGADALLLESLHERVTNTPFAGPMLTINDTFGALATAIAPLAPATASWSDSRLAHLALAENLLRNGITAPVEPIPATATPTTKPAVVLWRIPKSLPLLEQQIARLQPLLTADATVLAAGMDKHLPPPAAALLERLGSVTRLPGRRKAHVFVIQPDTARSPIEEPRPARVEIGEFGLSLRGDANVFASGQLAQGNVDIGARLLIAQFGNLPAADHIADLGCGNGVLGILAQRRFPGAGIAFFDESYQAIAATRDNYASNCPEGGSTPLFSCDDGLSNYTGPPFDLVLCNPPFHQGHTVGDHLARSLFRQARNHLRPGGELWVVGNRHLRYEQVLKPLFGNCRRIADNPKFSVLVAKRNGFR